MTDILFSIGNEFFLLLYEMAPYLVLGFLIAGILHISFSQGQIQRFLGKKNFVSVLNAAILGVPLPLCSCGVIPTGVSFHKNGASKGASISFLISTPQTGVDSIMVTYSMMGLPFAIVRPIAALITGIAGGILTNTADNKPELHTSGNLSSQISQLKKDTTFLGQIKEMLHYAFIELLSDIAKWLLIGLVIAAVIAALVPDEFFVRYLDNSYLSILLVLIASVPVYVCATGSVPIAAVLLMKGLSPGAAFVFLMAGPATNAGTISVIGKSLGRRAMFFYLGSIISGAVVTGIVINEFLPAHWFAIGSAMHHHEHQLLPSWVNYTSSSVLSALLVYVLLSPYYKRFKNRYAKKTRTGDTEILVKGMTCSHCQASVEKNVGKIEGIDAIQVDLATGRVNLKGKVDLEKVKATVNDLGYEYGGTYS